MKSTRLMMTAAVLALACGAAARGAPAGPLYGDWGFDAAGMDKAVKPGDDFFKYANGAWDARTPIPDDKSAYGVDAVLADAAEKHVRGILEADPGAVTGPAAADAVKVHAAYRAFLDQARIEAAGAAPIAKDLAAIRDARSRTDLAALMGQASKGFQASIFDLNIIEDLKTPSRYAVYISQSGLGLSDRAYYLEASFAAKKAAYQAYVAQMLALCGWPDPDGAARAVVDYETRIAEVSWSRAERRNPEAMYNPATPSALQTDAPAFAWSPFLGAAGLGGVGRVIVMENTAIPKIAAIYGATPIETLKAWAAFHVADAAAPYLDHRFDDAHFAFRNKLLRGQKVEQERWKRAVRFVNDGMGEAVGRVYVAQYFPPDAKAKIDALVSELKVALGQRIDRLDWMSAATKVKAHEKLAQFTVKIAYPSKWRDYSAIAISDTDAPGDYRAFQAFDWNR